MCKTMTTMRSVSAEWRQVLTASPHFAMLPSEIIDSMIEAMIERSFDPGQALIRQDDRGDALLVVLEGQARVTVREERGIEHDVSAVKRCDVLGEMALVTGEPRSADVVASTPLRALALGADDFHDLARRHPQLGVVLSHLIADRLGGPTRDILGDKRLGGFRILRCIGKGGMAVAYQAEELRSGREVALKMMSHRLVYDAGAQIRFREEADIGETLDHPNIARLHGRFSAYGTHFLVLEYCDGPGLDELLLGRRAVPEALVRPIVGQLAQALQYVHQRGLIHRDVKPGNVRVTHAGVAKLMDFGLAKPVLHAGDRTETHETTLVGTPSYMAPEQFDDQGLDLRVDIYALACLTYALVGAGKPFRSTGYGKLIQEKATFTLPARERIGPGISAELHEFIDRGMHPDRDQRLDNLDLCLAWAAPIDVQALRRLAGEAGST